MDEKELVGRTRMENWGGAVLEKEAGRTRPRCQWMISFPREAGDTVSNEIFSRRTEEGRLWRAKQGSSSSMGVRFHPSWLGYCQ